MTSSDYIALSAVILSLLSFLYTNYTNSKHNERIIKKEQNDYLKHLTRLVNKIIFTEKSEIKYNILNSLREELTFCTCYENNTKFLNLSEDLDDNIFILCTTKSNEDFLQIKERCITDLRKFKN